MAAKRLYGSIGFGGVAGGAFGMAIRMALLDRVSTIMDFQFTSPVEEFRIGKEAIDQHFTLVYMITNGTTMVVQLLFTSLIMQRLGVGVALPSYPWRP